MPKSKWYDDKVNKKVEKVIESKLILVGEYVRGQVAILAPKVTGNLRASYVWVTAKQAGKPGGAARKKTTLPKPTDNLSVRIGTNVDYAIPVEFGTNKRQAKPHLRPGLQISKKAIKKLMELQ